MQIYVCVKHVPDSAANIRLQEGTDFDQNINWVVNPYDEQAIQEAVNVVKANGGEVVAVCVGPEGAVGSLRTALAMGAERAILVTVDEDPDDMVTAKALKAAIEADDKGCDMIFMGKQTIDAEGMRTMYRLGAAFGVPAQNNVVALEVADGVAKLESELEGGARQVAEMKLPCIIGASKGLNEPKSPAFPAIMKAKKKEVKQVPISELGVDPAQASVKLVSMEPVPERSKATLFEGSTEEMVAKLVDVMAEQAKVI